MEGERLKKGPLPTQPLAAPRRGGWSASAACECGESAPHRGAAQPLLAAPRSSPPARRLARPAAETHSPQELDLILASFSRFGHGSRGVRGASVSPRQRRALAAALPRLFLLLLVLLLPLLAQPQQRRANPRPYRELG